MRSQLAGAGPSCERPRFRRDLSECQLVGIEDRGDEQGGVAGDGDPDVDPPVLLDRFIDEAGVHLRVSAER
jgi:hypothetical protein